MNWKCKTNKHLFSFLFYFSTFLNISYFYERIMLEVFLKTGFLLNTWVIMILTLFLHLLFMDINNLIFFVILVLMIFTFYWELIEKGPFYKSLFLKKLKKSLLLKSSFLTRGLFLKRAFYLFGHAIAEFTNH